MRASLQKNVQQILHTVYVVHACDEARMQGIFWILRRVSYAPICQQGTIAAQDLVESFFLVQWLFHELIAYRWKSACCRKSKICGQLFRRLPQGQLKQFCGKVDYITIRSTAKAVKPGIHFHAGIAVFMERAANHAAAVGLKAIGCCGLSDGDIQLYDFK